MAWIPFLNRPEPFRQGLATYAQNASPPSTPEAVYDQHELGLLSDADIQTWLDQKTKTAPPEVVVTDEAPPLSSPWNLNYSGTGTHCGLKWNEMDRSIEKCFK